MKLGLVLLMAAACGGEAQHPAAAPATNWRHPGAAFVEVVQTHDAAAIAAHLHEPLGYGGMWFPDPACTQQFPTQRKIQHDELPAFAACLAKLPLVASKRAHAQYDLFVVDYEPGFEIELQMVGHKDQEQVAWIGYSERKGYMDALPTVSGEALAALRTDHAPAATLPPGVAPTADIPYDYAWVKVCLDATGALNSVHPRESTSPDVELAMTALAQQWTFAPFSAGGSAIPVCGMVRLTTKPTTDAQVLPLAMANEGGFVTISNNAAKRVAGTRNVTPDDSDKVALAKSGVERIVATFKTCWDETGAMVKVVPTKPSGLPSYDLKIEHTIFDTWRYRPVFAAGKPTKACTGVTFIYTQTGSYASSHGRTGGTQPHEIPTGPHAPTPSAPYPVGR